MIINRSKAAPAALRSFRITSGFPLAVVIATASVSTLAGCKATDLEPQVAGWSVVDSSQRHPILVSQQPSSLSLRVPRGSTGMSPHQKAQVIAFVGKYRAADAGNSKLVISAPSGAPNEVAAMQAVAEIRHLVREGGFSEASVTVEAYHEDRDPQPAIRISYLRFIAEGPQCGHWPTNVADETQNNSMANLGCANQRNFAAQVANPADLLGPRAMTPGAADRRDVVWGKYIKGESSISDKKNDEKLVVKGAQ